MSKLFLTAKIRAKNGCLEAMLIEAKKLIEPTRKEEGCLVYELLSSSEDGDVYMFYEVWASEEDLQRHTKSPHFMHFLAVKDDCIEDLQLERWSFVN
ncbi:MAG: putative quinol monooxygenase [Bacteroidales bacterium]